MKTPAKIIIISSVFGFFNALYLFILFLQISMGNSTGSFCDVNEMFACSDVINAPIAKFLGLPVCAIAMFVYPLIGGLAYWALNSRKPQNQYFAIAILSAMGLTMNAMVTYNEYHFLHAVCLLCLICMIFITTNLIAAIIGFAKNNASHTPQKTQSLPIKAKAKAKSVRSPMPKANKKVTTKKGKK